MASSPDKCLGSFIQCHPATAYLIAFSGGLDSHVLLHLCAVLRKQHQYLQFRAVHIDHGLQAASAMWAEHCCQICLQLAIPFTSVKLNLQPVKGESIEAVARTARYGVFRQHVHAGEMLLAAHHQDDQAETLLLHLLRGSGVDGLAAMPEVRPFGNGNLGRPLLPCSRQQLQAYANRKQLDYLHDPSNTDTRFDRNFLRQQVFPLLKQRWPSASAVVSRVARLQGESRDLLAMFLQEKLLEVQGKQQGTLSVQALLAQALPLQKTLLREWLKGQQFVCPDEKRLLQVVYEVLPARQGANPVVHWDGCEVRRYRDALYALAPLSQHDPTQMLVWENIHEPLFLPSLGQSLSTDLLAGWYDWLKRHPRVVTVRFRRGGETMRVPYRGGKYSLKQLLQEAGIPPWLRERLPLIYIGERLIAIAGVLTIRPTAADA